MPLSKNVGNFEGGHRLDLDGEGPWIEDIEVGGKNSSASRINRKQPGNANRCSGCLTR